MVKSYAMNKGPATINRLRSWELWPVTFMSFGNMTGVDPQFTRLAHNPLLRFGGYLFFPFYLGWAGRGYKAEVGNKLAGYAFLHVRRISGIIFNVSVNKPFRRKGIARQLMDHLEAEIVREGANWAALQVDQDNTPAVRLYEGRGYRPVSTHYWKGNLPRGVAAPGTEIEWLPPTAGRNLFRHYLKLELDAGEKWAAQVMKREFLDLPARGRFYRCRLYDHEMGCAWLGRHEKGPAVQFAFQAPYWGQALPLVPLLRLLLDQADERQDVQITLSSTEHHNMARPVLQAYGFQEQQRERLLMLKPLRKSMG